MKLPIKLTFPDAFFDEEMLCGYKVETRMKKIWAVEIDLLNELIKICDEYHLTYYLFAGTMLGAVRHQGMIPWDNDIDIILPRKDYDKLLEIGPHVFKEPYYFQTPKTEDGKYFYFFAKLCNNQTTARSDIEYKAGQNCGIFVDIFPLDKLPDGKCSRKLYLKQLNTISKMARFSGASILFQPKKGKISILKMKINKLFFRLIGSPKPGEIFDKYNRVAGKYKNKDTKECGFIIWGYKSIWKWKCEDWEPRTQVQFGPIMATIPEKYDTILSTQFGNYMQFPPEDQRQCHEYYDFDAETPYKEYFERKLKG